MDKDSIAEIIEGYAREINKLTIEDYEHLSAEVIRARTLVSEAFFGLAYAFREGLKL